MAHHTETPHFHQLLSDGRSCSTQDTTRLMRTGLPALPTDCQQSAHSALWKDGNLFAQYTMLVILDRGRLRHHSPRILPWSVCAVIARILCSLLGGSHGAKKSLHALSRYPWAKVAEPSVKGGGRTATHWPNSPPPRFQSIWPSDSSVPVGSSRGRLCSVFGKHCSCSFRGLD